MTSKSANYVQKATGKGSFAKVKFSNKNLKIYKNVLHISCDLMLCGGVFIFKANGLFDAKI